MGQTAPTLRDFRILERNLLQSSPYAQYEYVEVTFNSTADADTDIRHTLLPPTPEDLDYQVVRLNLTTAPTTTPIIYRDSSASRRAWGAGYLVLRATVASLSATLLLTVRR